MGELVPAKLQAARAAAALVQNNMVVGLGSGSTASLMIECLGERFRSEGLSFTGVPSSDATATLARSLGIPLRDIDEVPALDLNLDGADEVDRAFQLIKGRGGALLREKILATAARRRITVVTADKQVERLGMHQPVPVEVDSFGIRHTEQYLRHLGASTTIRLGPDGSRYATDGGNPIIDCRFDGIGEPEVLHRRIKEVVGVYETGLFFGLCDVLVVGHLNRVEIIERPEGGIDRERLTAPGPGFFPNLTEDQRGST